MKRRANMAAGLLHRPKLLVLDEPTVGVDPQSRNAILETVGRLGIAVLYTTHYMEEAAKLCDRIGIIDDGHLIAEGTADSLITAHGGRDKVHLACDGAELDALAAACRELHNVHEVQEVDGNLELTTDHGPAILPAVVAVAVRHGVDLTGVEVRSPNLEDVFLSLDGERAAGLIRVIALNELKRRLRDRSVLIGCLAAPLLMSAVLGLSLAGNGEATVARIGVSGASPSSSRPPCTPASCRLASPSFPSLARTRSRRGSPMVVSRAGWRCCRGSCTCTLCSSRSSIRERPTLQGSTW